jgi:hypothetical protein
VNPLPLYSLVQQATVEPCAATQAAGSELWTATAALALVAFLLPLALALMFGGLAALKLEDRQAGTTRSGG